METDKITNLKKIKGIPYFTGPYLCLPLDERCMSRGFSFFIFFAVTKKAPKKTQHPLVHLFETGVPKQTIKKKKKPKTYSHCQSRGEGTSRSAKVESKRRI